VSAAWVVYVLGVGALLAVGASVLAAACRQLGWPTRWAPAAALAGIVALALMAPSAPRLDLRAPTGVTSMRSTTSVEPTPVGFMERLVAIRVAARGAVTASLVAVSAAVPAAATRALAIVWIVTTTLLLSLFAAVNVRLLRARRSWTRERLLGIPVDVSPDVGPAVIGFARAEIVVPRSLLARSSDEQRLILAHEHEHLAARDHLLLGGACVIAALIPWHPAAWHLLGRLRLAIELDCDARVLRAGASPRSYATLLIDVATHHAGLRIGALALTDGPSHLERRILAMQRSPKRHALAYGSSLIVAASVLVLVACEAKMPTAAEIVATARHRVAVPTPADRDVDYFINGVKTSVETANALDERSIGSVEVVKSERANGRDTVFLTTIDRMPNGGDSALRRIALKATGGNEQTFERKVVDDSKQRMPLRTGRQPSFLIDGRLASMNEVAALPDSAIRSVNVFKRDGGSISGEAADGVVAIKTRRSMKQ
jgi:beta-lactamase regulating signal transducer with metallopeptidase domain